MAMFGTEMTVDLSDYSMYRNSSVTTEIVQIHLRIV